MDFDKYDGLGLAELIRRRDATPAECLEAAIARIEARNPALNAIVTRLDERRAPR
jgi:Asp-tRNA(Asn)/Glu-tRNA(Gln) amidotransferase A subunit family amidase